LYEQGCKAVKGQSTEEYSKLQDQPGEKCPKGPNLKGGVGPV